MARAIYYMCPLLCRKCQGRIAEINVLSVVMMTVAYEKRNEICVAEVNWCMSRSTGICDGEGW